MSDTDLELSPGLTGGLPTPPPASRRSQLALRSINSIPNNSNISTAIFLQQYPSPSLVTSSHPHHDSISYHNINTNHGNTTNNNINTINTNIQNHNNNDISYNNYNNYNNTSDNNPINNITSHNNNTHHSNPAFSRSRSTTSVSGGQRGPCLRCGRNFRIRLDGLPHRHNCQPSILPTVDAAPSSPSSPPHLPIDPPVAPIPPRVSVRVTRSATAGWAQQHVQLINVTVASTTVAQFEERLLAVLHHTPPGAKVQPTVDNTPPPRSFDDPLDDNEDTDDSFNGMSQATVPHSDRILRTMDRHILNGDMLKARRSTKGGGVANIGDKTVLANLRLKYPRGTPPQQPPGIGATRTNLVDHLTVRIEDSTSLASHIMSKKRGASTSSTGHSNDHYQDILRQNPDAIHSIMALCNLIALGTLPDGPARTLLLGGKGTALYKPDGGLRPVVTANPLAHYTGHSIATEFSVPIARICGDEQFMNKSSGCEIVAHFIRHQLELDPSIVVAKVDVKNAFNEIAPSAILDVVRAQLPAVLSYAEFLLALSPIKTTFHDSRARVTSIQYMATGVQQGGSFSSALFNMGQSTPIRRALLDHPAVSILLIADDTHVVGKPEDVIAAILTIRALYAEIGLVLAATTASKNVIYGLGTYTAAQHRLAFDADLHWIPSSLGLQVGGTPIGSEQHG